MEHQLITVKEESLKISLKIHKGKTKFMTNIDTTENIQIYGTEIEKVIVVFLPCPLVKKHSDLFGSFLY